MNRVWRLLRGLWDAFERFNLNDGWPMAGYIAEEACDRLKHLAARTSGVMNAVVQDAVLFAAAWEQKFRYEPTLPFHAPDGDKDTYIDAVIERMFGRLKNWKRIATLYDRLAVNYLAAIALVALATQWLK